VIHLDSSLLIDLARDSARDRAAAAFEALEALDPREVLGASVFVVSELRAGAELSKKPLREHEELDRLLSGLLIVHPDERFAPMYGRLLTAIHRQRQTISTMDLLIATAALLDDAALMTRNLKDFSRVPGLRLIGY